MPSYGYLVALIPYSVIWLFCYVWRPDVRREMLWIGWFMAAASFITAYFWWTIDWWHPLTITHTRVGIEDLLLGFFSGGIMASVFHVFFREHLRKIKHKHQKLVQGGAVVMFAIMALLVHFGFTSFWASTYCMMIWLTIMLLYRPDLFRCSFISGLLMVICSIPGYAVALSYGHDAIRHIYDFRYLSGFLIGGIPIEEFVFWFLAGAIWGSTYEWMKGFRFKPDSA